VRVAENYRRGQLKHAVTEEQAYVLVKPENNWDFEQKQGKFRTSDPCPLDWAFHFGSCVYGHQHHGVNKYRKWDLKVPGIVRCSPV
jgi:hypothetical protein